MNMQWYNKTGIPYRRGYLLHGPSGTGKGSLVEAIAGALKMDIYYHIFTGVRIDDEQLNKAFNSAPANSLIVLDDLEYLWVPREHWDPRPVVTSAGILNALDGIRA
jgi:chaperone BCS1